MCWKVNVTRCRTHSCPVIIKGTCSEVYSINVQKENLRCYKFIRNRAKSVYMAAYCHADWWSHGGWWRLVEWRAYDCTAWDLCHSWGKWWYSRVSTFLWSSWGIYNHLLLSSSLPLHVYAAVQVCEWDGGHISLTPLLCCVFLSLFCLPYSVSSLFLMPQSVTLTQAAITRRQRSYLKRCGGCMKTSSVISLFLVSMPLVYNVPLAIAEVYYPPYGKVEK